MADDLDPAAVQSHRARPHAIADCLTCGESGAHLTSSPAAQRAWAQRHAEQNRRHVVHVLTENVRVYQAKEDRVSEQTTPRTVEDRRGEP